MERVIFLLAFVLLLFQKIYTQPKYLLPCKRNLILLSREILQKQVGVCERTNRNDGDKIKKYLESVGLAEGNPYCVAGQYYCFAEAASLLNLSRNEIPLPRTGLSSTLFNYAKRKGQKTKPEFSTDDLVVWIRPRTIHGHTERIVLVGRKGWVETIGFNTRRYDRRSGKWLEGVFRWKRNLIAPFGKMYLLGIVGFRAKENVH